MNRLLACLLFALSLPATAQIYTYTDANGNSVFTNDPPGGVSVQSVNLPPTNTVADTPTDSSADQSVSGTPPPAPTSTAPASSTSTSDDDSDGGYAYDNQQELRDDADPARAAAIDANTPGPARLDTPTIDAIVPGPGKIEEGRR